MLKAETTNRAPRGTKPVMQAFFTALDAIPEASRAAVGKAAQAMIRDEMKGRKDKLKLAAAKEKEKTRKPAEPAKAAKAAPAPKAAPKAAAAKKPAAKRTPAAKANGAEPAATPAKRRPRKTAEAPTTA